MLRIFYELFDHNEWLTKLEDETNWAVNREAFIVHYKNKYADFPTLPIWMVTEVMSLGNLSRGYYGLKHEDKRVISEKFDLHHLGLADWLRTLIYIRNICSHHGRLWNKELTIAPGQMRRRDWNPPVTPRNDRLFYILLILRHLLSKAQIGDERKGNIENLLDPIAKKDRFRRAMGMPENWEAHPIWR